MHCGKSYISHHGPHTIKMNIYIEIGNLILLELNTYTGNNFLKFLHFFAPPNPENPIIASSSDWPSVS